MTEKTIVERELLDATGEKPKRQKENPGEYLVRVAEKTSSLPDAEYERLSAGAKAWFTQAAEVLNTDSPDASQIEPFTKFDQLNAESGEESGDSPATTDDIGKEPVEDTTKVKKSSKKSGKKKAESIPIPAPEATPAAKKPTAAPKPPKEKKPAGAKPVRETSVADTIRGIMCEAPELSKEDVAKELKARKLSFETSRLDQIYHATARVLDLLKQLKKLK